MNFSRELAAAQTVFESMVADGYAFAPQLILYRNDERILSVVSRDTDEGKRDETLALVEMMVTIPVCNPDEALVVADTWFALRDDQGNETYSCDPRNEFARHGRPVVHAYGYKKDGRDFAVTCPYLVDNDKKVWWLHHNALERPSGQSKGFLPSILERMFEASQGELLSGYARHKVMSMLSRLGHDIRDLEA